jgi:hypothetical protein
MDALEFFNTFNRMCNTFRSCAECRIDKEVPSTCYNNINNISDLREIEKVIEIVEDWSIEHPVKTNLDVFRETFPDWETQTNLCKICEVEHKNTPCSGCSWWNEEYKENR